jgi:hypothetical protein
MSTSDDIHLDLQVIAGLLGPEDLSLQLKGIHHSHFMHDDTPPPTK